MVNFNNKETWTSSWHAKLNVPYGFYIGWFPMIPECLLSALSFYKL